MAKKSKAANDEPTRAGEVIRASLRRASAAQKKQWQQASKKLERLRGGGAKLFDEFWETVDDVMRGDSPLYLGGGFRTDAAFIAKMLPGEDKQSVRRNRLVAIAFTPKDEATKGLAFLEEVAMYVQELSGSREVPRAIDLDRLRIPVRRADGDVVRTPARACTREQLRAARDALGKKTRRPVAPAEAAITKAMRGKKPLASVKVRASATHASFTGVPLDALRAFAAALAKLDLTS